MSVRVLILSNTNISETRGPIAIKLYLKRHLNRGKAALGFEPGRVRTLVSMETDSYNKVIIGKML